MAADNELPVWTIRPNWLTGIRERLDWLTDVMAGTYGTEQRRALRLSPRRSFEMTFNPFDDARSYFDLWLHRFGSQEFMLPLFHDRATLTAPITAGQDTIPIDTTFREFEADGMAVIIGDDPFTFNVLEISAVAAGDLTVDSAGVTAGWPAGTAVYPLRRSRVSQESLFAAITSRVGEATLLFELNQASEIADEGAWDYTYGGVPIILAEPNRRERIDSTYIRNSMVLDNEHGLRLLLDDAGRAFTIQTHLRQMRGRADHWAFRQMLYRLRGMAAPVWLPTFNRDLIFSRASLAANAYVDIRKIGYAYTGGLIDGREHFVIRGSAPVAGQISGVIAGVTIKEERLNLAAPFGANLPIGTAGSFLEIARQNSDSIEIHHITDTDGVAECNLAFRAFRDERVVAGDLLDSPILPAAERATECGSVEQTLMTWSHNFDYHFAGVVDANPPEDTVIPAGPFDQNGNAPFGNDYNFEPPHPIATAWTPNRNIWLRTNVVCDFTGTATFTGVIENGVVVFIDGAVAGWNNYQNVQQGGAYGVPFEFTAPMAAGAHEIKILIMDEGANATGNPGAADNTYFHIEAVLRG